MSVLNASGISIQSLEDLRWSFATDDIKLILQITLSLLYVRCVLFSL